MDSMNRFVKSIDNLLESNQNLLEASDSNTINVKNIEQREQLIKQLSEITSKLDSVITRAKAVHAKELQIMDSLLTKMKNTGRRKTYAGAVIRPVSSDVNARPVAVPTALTASTVQTALTASTVQTVPTVQTALTASTVQTALTALTAPTVQTALTVHTHTPKTRSHVKFTEALYLPAVRVPTFDYVKQDGELYYVEAADHFAFKLCGHLLHGNIGMIYTEEKSPEKIKDCKFAASCMKRDKCDYYHDPIKFSGSKDRRNFIASSWLYAPPNSQYKNRPRSRRFGSREHLDTDISGLQPEEISRFQDQSMHDLLCSLLLSHAYAPCKN